MKNAKESVYRYCSRVMGMVVAIAMATACGTLDSVNYRSITEVPCNEIKTLYENTGWLNAWWMSNNNSEWLLDQNPSPAQLNPWQHTYLYSAGDYFKKQAVSIHLNYDVPPVLNYVLEYTDRSLPENNSFFLSCTASSQCTTNLRSIADPAQRQKILSGFLANFRELSAAMKVVGKTARQKLAKSN